MSKRPSSPPLEPADAKRINLDPFLEEKYKKVNAKIHKAVRRFQSSEDEDEDDNLLAQTLLQIFANAPPEARMKATPTLDECAKLIEDNSELAGALRRAIDHGSYKEVMSLCRRLREICWFAH